MTPAVRRACRWAAPALAASLAFAATAAQAATPKLIVAISVDQYSANLFDEWRTRYTGGFARLAAGVDYSAGFQTHAGTETCPGHSTLLTGKHPNKTGIVANTYRDPESGKVVYCVNDPSVVIAGDPRANPVGPQRLMATTLGDWMKAATPQSRVVAVSGKDRAAITMGGHHADGTFWLVGGVGLATYMAPTGDAAQALAPVAGFNRRIAKVWTTRPQWTYAHADCRAAAADWTLDGKTWASKLPPDDWGVSDDPKTIAANAMASPIADELTGQAAVELIDRYHLGHGPATDLLAVSFSATDFVGHRYGTRGPEMCEEQHRLDETLGRLFAKLDSLKVPYLVVLAADHGGSDFTERLQAEGYPAKRVSNKDIMARVNQALVVEFHLTAPPLQGNVEEATLVGVPAADRQRVLEAAVRALRAEPDVAAAFTREDLLATPIRKGASPEEVSVKERFAMSVYAGRSPDILAALQPMETIQTARPGDYIAGHGAPWDYDRRVPILFWWPGVKAQWRFLPIETVDIAPTLAAAVGVTPPADVDGRCLQLPDGGGVRCPR
ncbi:alkaline phosphatase family protein [Phenylobacterium sp.]|uniref:alkaline phosphatase family protein n=1 Tax=Phenylobacterium sp. TaxID=1871053 RepID=UPI001229E758|nr:alkaline phosphatase family protein [Phenylobacterium sp.]THD64785.1 MAG: alkaline phosphatase family protein [Phenylobacterium sp.]